MTVYDEDHEVEYAGRGMSFELYLDTLRGLRHGALRWGAVLLGVCLVVLLPGLFLGASEQWPSFLSGTPRWVAVLVGEGSALSTPTGWINVMAFALGLPVLLSMVAAQQGARAVAGEEEHGALVLLLVRPLSRRKIVLIKFAAILTVLFALAAGCWLVLAAGVTLARLPLSLWKLAAMALNLLLLGAFFASLGLALGCLTGKVNAATSLTVAAVGLTFLLFAVSHLEGLWTPLRILSPFYYYYGGDPLLHGLNGGHVAVLVGAAALFVALAISAFNRRDLAL